MPRTKKNPLQTKRGNYLLRSARREDLLNLMALVHAGRVSVGANHSHLIKADNTWAGHATWGTRALVKAGLIREAEGYQNGRIWFELTSEGHKALGGALAALDRRIDTGALLNKLDATRVE